MTHADIGRYQVMLILLSGLCSMGGQLEFLNIGVIMPYAKCDLNLSQTEQGLLASVSFFGIFATIYLWGYMADVSGRQKALKICTAGGFFFAFLSVFAFDVFLLTVLRFITGAL